MADKAFQDRMKAYNDAFHRDESEKHFESEIEKFLISPEGGWVKADDSGYRNDIYRGMALDVVTLTDFVKASQPMAWRHFERMCNIDPVRQFYKAFDSAVQQVGLIEVLRHGFKHRGVQFSVCYFAPESTLNTLAVENYQKNVCQCIRQWHYSETNNNTVDIIGLRTYTAFMNCAKHWKLTAVLFITTSSDVQTGANTRMSKPSSCVKSSRFLMTVNNDLKRKKSASLWHRAAFISARNVS